VPQQPLFGESPGKPADHAVHAARRWKKSGAEVHIGPAGWSYADWEGVVYPQPKPRGFRAAAYLARWFNTIELNNTFYRPPAAKMAERWVKDIADRPDFLYTAKLWNRFTHERAAPPGRAEHWTAADARTFREGIGPLTEAGRLGALLMQFPWSFHYNEGSQTRVRELVEEFGDLPLVVEVRSGEWVRDEPLDFIRSLGVGFCNIDQPPMRGNIPLTAHAFGRVGYLRLHGRNAAAWFAEDAGRDQRYDYLYGPSELDDIEAALGKIAEQVERMFVIANNHYRGQAVATGLELVRRAVGEEMEPPGRVGEMYDLYR
jgi:uncharacterized protein YecE (DUF72 family)